MTPSAELIAEPFTRFFRLATPTPNPAAADVGLTFTAEAHRRRRGTGVERARRLLARRRVSLRPFSPLIATRVQTGRRDGPRAADSATATSSARATRSRAARLEPRLQDGSRRPPVPMACACSFRRRRQRSPTRLRAPRRRERSDRRWMPRARGPPTSRWTATSTSSSACAMRLPSCCETTATARGSV